MTASFPWQITQQCEWRTTEHLTLKLLLKLLLEIKGQAKGHSCVRCPERLTVAWDHFNRRADVIFERYSLLRPLILNLALKVKYQVKVHGCCKLPSEVSRRLRPFWTASDVIFGRCPVLSLILKVKHKVNGHDFVPWEAAQGGYSHLGRFGARADAILGRYPVLCPWP